MKKTTITINFPRFCGMLWRNSRATALGREVYTAFISCVHEIKSSSRAISNIQTHCKKKKSEAATPTISLEEISLRRCPFTNINFLRKIKCKHGKWRPAASYCTYRCNKWQQFFTLGGVFCFCPIENRIEMVCLMHAYRNLKIP